MRRPMRAERSRTIRTSRTHHLGLALTLMALAALASAPREVHAAFGPAMRAPDLIDVGAQPEAVAAGDLNGDGLPDLVVGRRDGAISILLHYDTGFYPGLYRPGILKKVGTYPVIGVALADMNNDGNLDAVLTLYGYGVVIMLGDGRGDFGSPVGYPVGSGSDPVTVADVNGDGRLDVVLVSESTGTGYVLLGTGSGTLQAPATYGPFMGSTRVQDVTGDGIADLVDVFQDILRIFPGNPAGTFNTSLLPDTLANPATDAVWQFAIGDMNGDSVPDLVFRWTSNYGQANKVPYIGVLLGTGGGSFQSRASYPSSLATTNTRGLLLGDMDGNGTMDVVTVDEVGQSYSTIEVAKGNGGGTLGGATLYGEPSFANQLYPNTSVVLADVDADGFPDLVEVLKEDVFANEGYSVALVRNDGSGGFAQPLLSALGLHPSLPIAADFNGDGKPDLALADQVSAVVKIAPGDGTGTFTSGSLAFVPFPVVSMTAGDFNRDGAMDLVTSDVYDPIQFIAGSPTGTLASPIAASTVSYLTHPRSMGDMNRDGIPDLVVDAGSGEVAVLLGNGNGTFLPQPAQGFLVGSISDLVLGDWNRDGYLDVAGASSAGLSVIFGGPGGALSGATSLFFGGNWTAVCAGDFNRDGILDLAARMSGDSLATPQGIYIWLGDGTGNFTLGQTIPTPVPRGYTIEAVDVNHDGKLDLVAEGVSYSSTSIFPPDAELEVYLGNGDGTFNVTPWADGLIGTTNPIYGPIAVADVDRDGTPDAVAPVQPGGPDMISTIHLNSASKGNGLLSASFYPTVSGPRSIAVGDLNRDGKLDVVTCTSGGTSGVAVNLGNGSGSLGAVQAVAGSGPASKVVIADFNRDGIPDIATLNNTSPPYGLTTMLGTGDGTHFGTPHAYFFNSGLDFAVGDMNRDGMPDIVAATPDSIRFLYGAAFPAGTFTAGPGVALPGCTHIELADLNHDGLLDVICACGSVKVIYGSRNSPFFLPPVTIPGPVTTCTTLCVADFNRDGFLDIEANQGGQWYIFWGAATSPFSTSAVSTLPFAPNAVVEGDAEANGTPYLYAARNPGQVDVLSVSPTGAIASVGSYAVKSSPGAIALGDFNRDGGLDVVTVSPTDSTVAINLHGAGTATGVEPIASAPPAHASLLQNFPNPFNPRTTIRYALPRDERDHLAVFDVQGRLVVTLRDGIESAGNHVVSWDGRDGHGEAVDSGVYFYALTTESGEHESKRMVLLK
jgi:VCBS repeat protein/flagellar hook capping protein FlgD